MPPTAVKHTSVNLTSMTIIWDPITCIQRNSLIRNYIVNYTGESDRYSRSINTSTTETTITLYKLDPSTNYIIEVQAESENNIRSPPSSSIEVMTSVPKGKTQILILIISTSLIASI